MQLIPTQAKNGIETVNARDLHNALQVGRDFSTWIKDRIEKYRFENGVDFITESRSPIPGSGNRGAAIEYYITFDMAKELAMVENTEVGRRVRKYFIEVEKRARQLTQTVDRKKSIEARNALTDMWKAHGVDQPWQYGKLTKLEYEALGFGENTRKANMTPEQIALLHVADGLETFKLLNKKQQVQFDGCAASIITTGFAVRELAQKSIEKQSLTI